MDWTVVLVREEDGGYWARVPALPGCFSQGDDLDEALEHVAEAIQCHVEALVPDGDAVPANVTRVEVDLEIGAEVVVRLVSVEGLASVA